MPRIFRRSLTSTLVSAVAVGTFLLAAPPSVADTQPPVVYHDEWPTLAADAFTRTSTEGWGTARAGGKWTHAGVTSSYRVNGSAGTIAVQRAGSTLSSYLGGVSSTDTDVTVSLSTNRLQTGTGSYVSVVGRRVGTVNLGTRLRLRSDSTVAVSLLDGSATIGLVSLPRKLGVGTKLMVRTQVIGTAPTTLRTKVWFAGTSEPTAWTVKGVSAVARTEPGTVGVSAYLAGSVTNAPITFTFDNFAARTTKPVSVANYVPTAQFSATVTGASATLDGTASSDVDGTIASWAWAFGDGTTGTGQRTSHKYLTAGQKSVTLTVTDNSGAKHSTTKTVTPQLAAMPSADNTGVPAGKTITKVVLGNVAVTTDGTVIDGWDIRGYVSVRAKNVVIRNSYIRGAAVPERNDLVRVQGDAYSVTIEDSTLVAQTMSPNVDGVKGWNFTLRRVEIANVIDTVHIHGSNVLVEDSWMHDNAHYYSDPNWNGGPSHSDSVQIQSGSNITVRHSTITGSHNAAFMVTQGTGPVTNLSISGNYLDDGACTINEAASTYGAPTGMAVLNNVFGRGMQYAGCAVRIPTAYALDLRGNTYQDGAVVTRTNI